jgi:hypothetical protein
MAFTRREQLGLAGHFRIQPIQNLTTTQKYD